ncbi:M1 family metallopeptidase [Chryseobacterium gallinarum]|uniref:M1 family metallopeptidase n=1 Tax=Chryseobacterium gallinarum TaxID=1324352 RepID=UPI0020257F1E|nr:M1 family metallopeptidase [Chryseobacterium gallinarum]MCL8537116.1 M1 family metallopeptidase [Chryseobacterium gallinarum]
MFRIFFSFIFLVSVAIVAQQPTREDSLVGSVTPEKAWWDLLHYDITVKPDYPTKTLTGNNKIKYKTLSGGNSKMMQIDLVKPLTIDSAFQDNKKLTFHNKDNIWYISLPKHSKSKSYELNIYYSGKPVESVSPPWDGGMVWAKDSLNRPWISVACQYKGASLWYPCKNMLYDEPDEGASISIIVPADMTAVGNGRWVGKKLSSDRTAKYTWKVVNPINHYGISFYAGNYVNISQTYQGRKGKLDMSYWILDYNRQKALDHMIPEAVQTMKSLERWFGPYPFYEDGFKIVEATYIGMEHQSAIAYGNNYTKGTFKGKDISKTGWGKKTDRLIVHETAHEWFGNSITASDIADRWIQEGFAGLAEELVIADLCGRKAGEEFLVARYKGIDNEKPIIGRYGINEDSSSDNYIKGWAVIHMIKTIMNDDEKFRKILQGVTASFYHKVTSTQEIEDYIITKSGMNFKPLFNQYLRTTQIPELEYSIKNNELRYRFTNCIDGFFMPVKIDGSDDWLFPTVSWQTFQLKNNNITEINTDPNFYIKVKKVE